jgi:hypothetical protein
MINLTQDDINVRLQLIQCCIGRKATSLLNKIKIGSKDVNCKLNEILVLQRMIKYLKCYNVLSDDVTEDDNCLTEVQAQEMFDYMIRKCDLCIKPPGFVYQQAQTSQFDDSFSESFG